MSRLPHRPAWTVTTLAASLLIGASAVAAPSAKTDKDLDAYVQSLVQKIADGNPLIRGSARDALTAIGKPALPALKEAAKGDDADVADAAKQLIAKIGDDVKEDDAKPDPRDGRDGRHRPDFRHGRWRGFDRFRGFRDGRDGFRRDFDGFRGRRFGPWWGWDGRQPGFPGYRDGRRRHADDGNKAEKKDEKKGEKKDEKPAPGPGPGLFGPGFGPMGLENALKDLNLTDKQKSKVDELFKAQREKMEKMHEDFIQSLKDVLDEDQVKKLETDFSKPPSPPDFFRRK